MVVSSECNLEPLINLEIIILYCVHVVHCLCKYTEFHYMWPDADRVSKYSHSFTIYFLINFWKSLSAPFFHISSLIFITIDISTKFLIWWST